MVLKIYLLFGLYTLNIGNQISVETEMDKNGTASDSFIIDYLLSTSNTSSMTLEIRLKNRTAKTVSLKPKESILSGDLKIETCINDHDCNNLEVADSKEECSYEGLLDSDQDSLVNIIGCDGEDIDLTLFTKKLKLKTTSYRKNAKTGKIKAYDKEYNMSEPIEPATESKTNTSQRQVKFEQVEHRTKNGNGSICCKIKEKTCNYELGKNTTKELDCYSKVRKEIYCGKECTKNSTQMKGINEIYKKNIASNENDDYHIVDVNFPGNDDYEDVDFNGSENEKCCRKKDTVCYIIEPKDSNSGEEEEICNTSIGKRMCGNLCPTIEGGEEISPITENTITTQNSAPGRVMEKNILRQKHHKQKILEIGITTDPPVYESTKRYLEKIGDDKTKITKVILNQIQRLIISAQIYIGHKTISETGGFKLKVNGITILKDWSDSMSDIKEEKLLEDQLSHWKKYLGTTNLGTDEDKNYHDISILLTGKNYSDVVWYTGWACKRCICNIDTGIVFTFWLENGAIDANLGRLLSHEMAHTLGAGHDKTIVNSHLSVFPYGTKMPCQKEFLMAPVVSPIANEYSECSRKDIDNDPLNKKTCYFI